MADDMSDPRWAAGYEKGWNDGRKDGWADIAAMLNKEVGEAPERIESIVEAIVKEFAKP